MGASIISLSELNGEPVLVQGTQPLGIPMARCKDVGMCRLQRPSGRNGPYKSLWSVCHAGIEQDVVYGPYSLVHLVLKGPIHSLDLTDQVLLEACRVGSLLRLSRLSQAFLISYSPYSPY